MLFLLLLPALLPPALIDGTIENRTPNGANDVDGGVGDDDREGDDVTDGTVGRSISWSCPISRKEEVEEDGNDDGRVPLFPLNVVGAVVVETMAPPWPSLDDVEDVVNIEFGGRGGRRDDDDDDKGGGAIVLSLRVMVLAPISWNSNEIRTFGRLPTCLLLDSYRTSKYIALGIG